MLLLCKYQRPDYKFVWHSRILRFAPHTRTKGWQHVQNFGQWQFPKIFQSVWLFLLLQSALHKSCASLCALPRAMSRWFP